MANGLKTSDCEVLSEAVVHCDLFSCEAVYDETKTMAGMETSSLISICFVVSGGGIHKVLDKEIPCQKGDVCIIAADVAYGFFLSDANDNLTIRRKSKHQKKENVL